MARLKMLIEPFVLRRIKKDVLTELPDKTITVLNNEIQGEQLKIYASYMAQARQEAKDEIIQIFLHASCPSTSAAGFLSA